MLIPLIISLYLVSGSAQPGTADNKTRHPARVEHVQWKVPPRNSPSFAESQCRSIADLSVSSRPVFTVTENGEWECTYLIEYSETGHKPSLFIQIRGLDPGIWSSFRLKLNFGSPLSRQVLGAQAADLVYLLIGTNTPVRDLDAMLAAGRELEMTFDDVTLKYRQERTDSNRFNLFGSKKLGPEKNANKPD
ncbi:MULTISPECIES: DUF6030 family protein [Agrobacterium]|uniref:Uncharacterized protein n=1 Tax=Agrobacterium rosae TaxID=1972867 RepID=A0A1R3TM60_9HYPH|nr:MULTISPECIES: DUF6030 family protein [Agrobacterium]SCX11123.1 hypothetical protein DSM25558_1452 [Agrobacterium sp. DSM 25558]SCX23207.1 hypothetical protein DSM25559_2344 [Agrobacterium rosae]